MTDEAPTPSRVILMADEYTQLLAIKDQAGKATKAWMAYTLSDTPAIDLWIELTRVMMGLVAVVGQAE